MCASFGCVSLYILAVKVHEVFCVCYFVFFFSLDMQCEKSVQYIASPITIIIIIIIACVCFVFI